MSIKEKMASLPVYTKPPVVETAFAIEFAPLGAWNLLHYGSLWEEFRSSYPRSEIHPAVFSTPPVELDMANPPVRCFFLNEEGTELVQVRSGAFVRNWRARQPNDEYPRYTHTRPSFLRDLEIFQGFLVRSGLPQLEVWKCEVTYVNHFIQGREWTDANGLSAILPILSTTRFQGLLNNLSAARFAMMYELPEGIGNMQIELTPGLRTDGKQIMQLSLSAFGPPKGSDPASLMEWMDMGRHAVVQGFSDFTAEEIQTKIWGRSCS